MTDVFTLKWSFGGPQHVRSYTAWPNRARGSFSQRFRSFDPKVRSGPTEPNNEIVVFKTDDETINVEVRFEDETAWLTQDQMATLFGKSKSTINEHIKNIFAEGELVESQVMRKFGNSEFTQNLTKLTNFYNLDVIISVGYRVKSLRGTQFRQWATKRLNEYIR
jgi:hypothetical protein